MNASTSAPLPSDLNGSLPPTPAPTPASTAPTSIPKKPLQLKDVVDSAKTINQTEFKIPQNIDDELKEKYKQNHQIAKQLITELVEIMKKNTSQNYSFEEVASCCFEMASDDKGNFIKINENPSTNQIEVKILNKPSPENQNSIISDLFSNTFGHNSGEHTIFTIDKAIAASSYTEAELKKKTEEGILFLISEKQRIASENAALSIQKALTEGISKDIPETENDLQKNFRIAMLSTFEDEIKGATANAIFEDIERAFLKEAKINGIEETIAKSDLYEFMSRYQYLLSGVTKPPYGLDLRLVTFDDEISSYRINNNLLNYISEQSPESMFVEFVKNMFKRFERSMESKIEATESQSIKNKKLEEDLKNHFEQSSILLSLLENYDKNYKPKTKTFMGFAFNAINSAVDAKFSNRQFFSYLLENKNDFIKVPSIEQWINSNFGSVEKFEKFAIRQKRIALFMQVLSTIMTVAAFVIPLLSASASIIPALSFFVVFGQFTLPLFGAFMIAKVIIGLASNALLSSSKTEKLHSICKQNIAELSQDCLDKTSKLMYGQNTNEYRPKLGRDIFTMDKTISNYTSAAQFFLYNQLGVSFDERAQITFDVKKIIQNRNMDVFFNLKETFGENYSKRLSKVVSEYSKEYSVSRWPRLSSLGLIMDYAIPSDNHRKGLEWNKDAITVNKFMSTVDGYIKLREAIAEYVQTKVGDLNMLKSLPPEYLDGFLKSINQEDMRNVAHEYLNGFEEEIKNTPDYIKLMPSDIKEIDANNLFAKNMLGFAGQKDQRTGQYALRGFQESGNIGDFNRFATFSEKSKKKKFIEAVLKFFQNISIIGLFLFNMLSTESVFFRILISIAITLSIVISNAINNLYHRKFAITDRLNLKSQFGGKQLALQQSISQNTFLQPEQKNPNNKTQNTPSNPSPDPNLTATNTQTNQANTKQNTPSKENDTIDTQSTNTIQKDEEAKQNKNVSTKPSAPDIKNSIVKTLQNNKLDEEEEVKKIDQIAKKTTQTQIIK